MAYYNYKQLRDSLPPEMVDKWAEEDGSADYDSTLWCYAADYIDQLTKERDEARTAARKLRDTFAQGEKLTWENSAQGDSQSPDQ